MEFFIRKGSNQPILKLKLIDDGLNDKSSFNSMLENSDITLDMFNVKTGEYQILNGVCNLTTRIKKFNYVTDEYFIVYQFSEEDTSKIGRYEGIITIQFNDTNLDIINKLILPIKEKMFINVI